MSLGDLRFCMHDWSMYSLHASKGPQRSLKVHKRTKAKKKKMRRRHR